MASNERETKDCEENSLTYVTYLPCNAKAPSRHLLGVLIGLLHIHDPALS